MPSDMEYESQIVFRRLNTWSSSTLKMLVSPGDFDGHENLKSCERNIHSISIAKKFINESFLHANYSKTFHLNFIILGLKKKDYKCQVICI